MQSSACPNLMKLGNLSLSFDSMGNNCLVLSWDFKMFSWITQFLFEQDKLTNIVCCLLRESSNLCSKVYWFCHKTPCLAKFEVQKTTMDSHQIITFIQGHAVNQHLTWHCSPQCLFCKPEKCLWILSKYFTKTISEKWNNPSRKTCWLIQ